MAGDDLVERGVRQGLVWVGLVDARNLVDSEQFTLARGADFVFESRGAHRFILTHGRRFICGGSMELANWPIDHPEMIRTLRLCQNQCECDSGSMLFLNGLHSFVGA